MPGIAAAFAFVVMGALPPQQPGTEPAAPAVPVVEAPAPAIELLLATPRALDAAKVRRRLARLLEVAVGEAAGRGATWLAADGTQLVGAHGGQGFTVRAAAAGPLPESALADCDDDERELLAKHRSRLVVTATAPLLDDGLAVHRALGPIAAALLLPDVLAMGAAVHGTFALHDAADPTLRRGLLGRDPLGALAPPSGVSLTAFLRAPRRLDEKALAQALAGEFGIVFDGKRNFLVVEQDLVGIGLAGQFVLVTQHAAEAPDEADLAEVEDLRLRRALAEHTAELAVASYGPPDATARDARQRLVARTLAALWGDDVLALAWSDGPMTAANAAVPAQLRAEDPLRAVADGGEVPVIEARDEAAMQQAIATARAQWATAEAHHRQGGRLTAKFPFPTSTGGVEHIWVEVKAITADTVQGTLANEPVAIPGKKLGSEVVCRVSELSDWLFLRAGKRVGGFTVDVLDRQQRTGR